MIKKWILKWAHKKNNMVGQGQPVIGPHGKTFIEREAKRANRDMPSVHHWVEEVKGESRKTPSD